MNPQWTGRWIAGSLKGPQMKGTLAGLCGGEPQWPGEPVFDLASLTKIVCTSTLLADSFVRSGLSWAQFCATPLADKIPELKSDPFAPLSLGEVWEHRSGIVAHRACFEPPRTRKFSGQRAKAWQAVLQKILQDGRPHAGEAVYSDLGFLLAGLWLERGAGEDLSVQWTAWQRAHGLDPSDLSFNGARALDRVVPTETRHPPGEVNDDNAASLGGIAPHAGLFGSAPALWRWMTVIADWSAREPRLADWLRPSTSARFHGGWDTPSATPSQAGDGAPPGVIGHLGYTGTALWWHPPTQRGGVLLTNRVFPAHSEASREWIRKLRNRFFTGLWQGTLSEEWLKS